ncbi:MAG: hypothetical protein Q9Q40_09905 [Acidobacteriota bacterium]|nr:hypothetical protein [Acidobacteriota bacterium]
MRTSVFCIVLVFAPPLAVMAESGDAPPPVMRFVRSTYSFARKVDRDLACHNVKDVTRELGLNRVSSQRVFSFPDHAGAPISHALVALGVDGSVRLLDDLDSIRKVFDAVPNDLAPVDVAQLLVDKTLLLSRFNVYRNDGYALGINVIRKAADIPGLSEQSLVALKGVIKPPKLVPDGLGYRFTAFSWEEAGGAVVRHVILVQDNRVAEYQVDVLATWVGTHGLLR